MNEFLVVHNGIITNYAALREMLMRHGFVFTSETDTEVIPKLAKYLYDSFPPQTKPSFLQLVQLVSPSAAAERCPSKPLP